jgi:hypothetical protein
MDRNLILTKKYQPKGFEYKYLTIGEGKYERIQLFIRKDKKSKWIKSHFAFTNIDPVVRNGSSKLFVTKEESED